MSRLLDESIRNLLKKHGSYRAAGKAIGTDHAYLFKILAGTKEPSAAMAAKLGLIRVVTYQRLK